MYLFATFPTFSYKTNHTDTAVKITIKNINETRKKLVVALSAEEVDEEERQVFKQFTKRVRLPGFRKGKAPEELVRRHHGDDINAELNRRLTSKAYDQAIEESKLDAYALTSIDGGKFIAGSDGHIELTVDINPKFNLPEYKGIPTKVPSLDVTEEEIEKVVDETRRVRADYQVVERAAAKGDYVKVSYEGKIEGRPITEIAPEAVIFGTQKNTWEEAGATDSPGVSAVVEALVGMKAGDKKEAEMDFDKDFSVEELAGQKGLYAIEVHEVREQLLPEMNEKFLKELGLESVEKFRENIRRNLAQRKRDERITIQGRQVSAELCRRIEFPLPESAVEEEARFIIRDLIEQNMRRGIPKEEFEKHKDEIYSNARQAASIRVKLNILLDRIASEEKITIEEKDMHQQIMMEAVATRTRPQKLVKELRKDRERTTALRISVLRNKTLQLLVDQAEVTEEEDTEKKK